MKQLAARFDAALRNQREPYPVPTAQSIAHIESRLALALPPSLLEFANISRSFSSFFLSLGPDIHNHSHIVAKNTTTRKNPDWLIQGLPAPEHLVFISENFMEDFFWCLDTNQPGPEYPVVYWTPNYAVSDTRQCHASFCDLISVVIAHHERILGK
jgi:hypothetical protein